MHEEALHPLKLSVACEFHAEAVIGSYFFQRYITGILGQIECSRFANKTNHLLKRKFGGSYSSRNEPVNYPPPSLDSFLWGHVKYV